MKATGIVRQVDPLGRLVLPKELRSSMGMDAGDSVEIFVDGDTVMLRHYQPGCIFCGSTNLVGALHCKNVCAKCVKQIGVIYEEARE